MRYLVKITLSNGRTEFDLISTVCAYPRLSNTLMLNRWLNMKNNCPRKRIKNQEMIYNNLWIPMFVITDINTSSESILIMPYLLFK